MRPPVLVSVSTVALSLSGKERADFAVRVCRPASVRMHDRARERAIAGFAFTFLLLSLPLTGSLVRGAISSERSRGLTVQYHKPSNPHTSFPRVRVRTPSLTFPGSPVTGHFLYRRVRPATQGFDPVRKGPGITVFKSGVPVPDRFCNHHNGPPQYLVPRN